MSSARRPRRAGFTLLECMVAVLVLNMVVLGMIQLVKGHQEVLDGVDDWTYGDPALHVVRNPDPLARALGVPAVLSVDPPAGIHRSKGDAYQVEVLEAWRDLDPARTAAVFRLSEAKKEEKKEKEKGKEKGKKKEKEEEGED